MSRTAMTVLLIASAACAPSPEPPRFEAPRPALTGVTTAVREQLESAASELDDLLAGGGVSDAEAAAAIGELGRLYHAYDLGSDAAVCYREAERLEPRGDWSYYLGFLQQVGGDLEAALESFGRALESDPGDSVAKLRSADSLAGLGRGEAAAELYRELLEIEPSAAAAHRGLGSLAAQAGRHAEAARHFEEALARQPQATAIHYQLAQVYRAQGRDADADRHAALAGTGQVSFPDPRVAALDRLAVGAGVRLARGGVALAEGRLDLALEEYERAVDAEPENPAARTNLALVLARSGRVPEAMEQLREALRLEGEDTTARAALAGLLLGSGDAREAVTEFTGVLERQPEHAGALRGRADAHLALGDTASALADFRALVEIEPEDGGARLGLGALLQESGDFRAAADQYRAALELEIDADQRGGAELSLGNVAVAAGDAQRALEHYEAALDSAPDLVEAAHNRAGVLSGLGRHAEAAEAYARVAELDPGNSMIGLYRGDALFQAGRFQAALEAFEGLAAREPDNELAQVGKLACLARLGRHAEALEAAEAVHRRLPDSWRLTHDLASLLASSPDRTLRDGERALELARRAFERAPSLLTTDTLAMALAEAGRFDEAVELQKRLIEFESRVETGDDSRDRAYLERLEATLRLYESGESCCPPPS